MNEASPLWISQICDLWCQLITLNFKLPWVYIWPGTTLGVSQGWLHFNRRNAAGTRAFPRARAAIAPFSSTPLQYSSAWKAISAELPEPSGILGQLSRKRMEKVLLTVASCPVNFTVQKLGALSM